MLSNELLWASNLLFQFRILLCLLLLSEHLCCTIYAKIRKLLVALLTLNFYFLQLSRYAIGNTSYLLEFYYSRISLPRISLCLLLNLHSCIKFSMCSTLGNHAFRLMHSILCYIVCLYYSACVSLHSFACTLAIAMCCPKWIGLVPNQKGIQQNTKYIDIVINA